MAALPAAESARRGAAGPLGASNGSAAARAAREQPSPRATGDGGAPAPVVEHLRFLAKVLASAALCFIVSTAHAVPTAAANGGAAGVTVTAVGPSLAHGFARDGLGAIGNGLGAIGGGIAAAGAFVSTALFFKPPR